MIWITHMTEHDAQLCADVARVMGLDNVRVAVRSGGTDELCLIDRDGLRVGFCPDTDPANAWEVLEWLESRDYVVLFRGHGVIIKTRDGTMRAGESGANWRQALCHTAAALGQ